MKTKITQIKMVLSAFALMLSPFLSSADANISELFDTEVIKPLQNQIASSTQSVSFNNTLIQQAQDLITSYDAIITDPNSTAAEITSVQTKRQTQLDLTTEYQDNIVSLQIYIVDMQALIATYQAYSEEQKKDFLLNLHRYDPDWITLYFPGTSDNFNLNDFISSNQAYPEQLLSESHGDPNDLSFIPPFVSTGNSAQDALLVHQWLVKRGLIKD